MIWHTFVASPLRQNADSERPREAAAYSRALTNMYGFECILDDVVELSVGEVSDSTVTSDDE
jgi:hypothetical protein